MSGCVLIQAASPESWRYEYNAIHDNDDDAHAYMDKYACVCGNTQTSRL